MMKTEITRTVNGLLRVAAVLAILASWREAIWIRVRCYESGKLSIVHPYQLENTRVREKGLCSSPVASARTIASSRLISQSSLSSSTSTRKSPRRKFRPSNSGYSMWLRLLSVTSTSFSVDFQRKVNGTL